MIVWKSTRIVLLIHIVRAVSDVLLTFILFLLMSVSMRCHRKMARLKIVQ